MGDTHQETVLVSLGCSNKIDIYRSRFWRLEVPDRSAGGFQFLKKACFLALGHLPALCVLAWGGEVGVEVWCLFL